MSDFFNPTPSAPNLAAYTPPSVNTALSQFMGQQSQLPALQSFANQVNTGANSAYQSALFSSTPGLQQNIAQLGTNTSALLNGQLPADVQTQVQNSAAYSSLMGGYGGSSMAHALTARDLGQTSLSLQQTGAQDLSQQAGLAQALNPTNMTTSSLFFSPQTILSSDQQAALINNQITDQNQQINYQNQIAANKGSPFDQMLTNNMASLLGMATNPLTAVSSVMSAEGGSYNPASANAGANFDGISSGGMASMGTYAVDPATGQNIGASTPGSTASSGASGAGGVSSGGMGGLSSLMGAMGACCFIFMEAYRGEMPLHVRECRDEFAPENTARRKGYIRMSKWLVPAMRVSPIVRFLVWHLMVNPMTLWGGFHKNVEGFSKYAFLRPVKDFWFNVWEAIGDT